VAAVLILAGCGGSSGGGGGSDTKPVPTDVIVSGEVTFDYVPAVVGVGLDYANTESRPVRGATVELIAADDDSVLASARTDDAGRYNATVPSQTNVFVRVKAENVQTGSPAWDYRVLDNTNSDVLYALDGAAFDSGVADSTRDLHAASGWQGSSYAAPRSAAPFAILDTVEQATDFVLASEPGLVFPPLRLHWSPDNAPTDGTPDLGAGELTSSFYRRVDGLSGVISRDIYLLGAENDDTDEYDRHVIAHEWGHYFADAFSRDDNIGGPHTYGDQLDMRTAFGEGWGNAFSAMATGDSVYTDTLGVKQAHGFKFDLEGENPLNPGWFSEQSVQEILYDLFDATPDLNDSVSLGFGPLYDVMTRQQRDTLALTSIFPFIVGLEADIPAGEASQIPALLTAQDMDDIVDAYGSQQTNAGDPTNGDPPSGDVLPIYRDAAVNGTPLNVCSTDAFESPTTGAVNKLGSRQFIRFNVPTAESYTMTATATDVPAGQVADPDMVLHEGDVVGRSDGPPTCEVGDPPAQCMETFTQTLAAGDYVLEVYEWTNTTADPDYPPIGRTCFDVEVTTP
jgi:hypothetical protein